MTFKELYQSVARHLAVATDGGKVVFTHSKFYGYEFVITARRSADE